MVKIIHGCNSKNRKLNYSKTCVKRPLSKTENWTKYRLMQLKSIVERSKGSILQYFRPQLSYHLSLRPLFCQFLDGRLHRLYFRSIRNERWKKVERASWVRFDVIECTCVGCFAHEDQFHRLRECNLYGDLSMQYAKNKAYWYASTVFERTWSTNSYFSAYIQ